MTPNAPSRHGRLAPIWLVVLIASGGCTSLKLPDLPATAFTSNPSETHQFSGAFDPQMSVSEQTYHAVRQAKAENSVVLQVVGDETPVRILPLPEGSHAVYVSELLEQTGVAAKLKTMEATLFRHNSESIGGLPMKVKMTPDGRQPQPVSDYALRPGDRLRVRKAASPALNGLLNAVLGL